LEHHDLAASSSEIRCTRQPVVPAPDDDRVIAHRRIIEGRRSSPRRTTRMRARKDPRAICSGENLVPSAPVFRSRSLPRSGPSAPRSLRAAVPPCSGPLSEYNLPVPIASAFHERTHALCESLNYRDWSGYYAVSAYETHHEHEYNAIRNACAL